MTFYAYRRNLNEGHNPLRSHFKTTLSVSVILQCKMVQKHENPNEFLSFNYTKFVKT